jgi:hypothetical protein
VGEERTRVQLIKQFNITGYPTFALLNKTGEEISRCVGFTEEGPFVKWLTKANNETKFPTPPPGPTDPAVPSVSTASTPTPTPTPIPTPTPTPYPRAADLLEGRQSVIRQQDDPSEPVSSTRPNGQTSVKAFVQGFWNHHESNDPNTWASDFASRAKYCYASGDQYASQRFIGQDRAELINRYPTRQYRFYGLAIEMQPGDYVADAHYAFQYSYTGQKRAAGLCHVSMTAQQISGRWCIVAYDEKVERR